MSTLLYFGFVRGFTIFPYLEIKKNFGKFRIEFDKCSAFVIGFFLGYCIMYTVIIVNLLLLMWK